ncbi:MAG: hypothetical protein K6E76_00535 [Patescibacteria group bacterium]|nr:hypothetical protein [Patescibacteria group bacterium]
MRDLNKTLTEKAKIFMNIAYLSDTTYKDKVKKGEIKFVFKDGKQEIQYGNLIINENTFFSEA